MTLRPLSEMSSTATPGPSNAALRFAGNHTTAPGRMTQERSSEEFDGARKRIRQLLSEEHEKFMRLMPVVQPKRREEDQAQGAAPSSAPATRGLLREELDRLMDIILETHQRKSREEEAMHREEILKTKAEAAEAPTPSSRTLTAESEADETPRPSFQSDAARMHEYLNRLEAYVNRLDDVCHHFDEYLKIARGAGRPPAHDTKASLGSRDATALAVFLYYLLLLLSLCCIPQALLVEAIAPLTYIILSIFLVMPVAYVLTAPALWEEHLPVGRETIFRH